MENKTLADLISVLPLRDPPTQQRAQYTVLDLLDAALAVVKRDGAHALTTAVVADEADVPIGTVYRYFRDRQDLIEALIVRQRFEMDVVILARMKKLSLMEWRKAIRSLIADLTAFARTRPCYLALHTMAQGNADIRNLGIAERWIESIVDSPMLQSTGIDTEVARIHFSVLVAAVQGLIPRLYSADEDKLEVLIDAASRMVTLHIEDVAKELGIPLL